MLAVPNQNSAKDLDYNWKTLTTECQWLEQGPALFSFFSVDVDMEPNRNGIIICGS